MMTKTRSAKVLAALFILCVILLPASAQGKVYIDITSPRQEILTAVHELMGPLGTEISDIITADLQYTGFFVPLDRKAFIEGPAQSFHPQNWSALGAEIVVKGNVRRLEDSLSLVVTVYDVFEGRSIFKKLYRAEEKLLRPLAHSISNDIYKLITGQDGVFRSKIAFIAKGKAQQEIHIMDWDGSRSRELGIKGSLLMSLHWSDDGRKLLYSSERNRKWSIYLLDFDDGRERLVYRADGTNIAGDFMKGGDEFLLSSSMEGTPDIYIYDLNRKRAKRITNIRGIEVSPTISPDGNTIAFVSDRGGSPQIYTTDKIGYNMSRVTYSGSYNTSPAWSPKGDRLAFSGRYSGKNQIFIVKPDGSGLQMLTDTGNNEDPSFSPDGRFIVFTSDRDGKKGIYTMRASGEAQRRVTPWALDAFGPEWAPR